jgi:hypothetical protein
MSGIGDERHRTGEKAIGGFDNYKCSVERDANGKGVAKIGRGMAMARPVPRMVMIMLMSHTHRAYL